MVTVKSLLVRLLGILLTISLLAACQSLLPMATSLLGGAADDGISVDAQVGDRDNEGNVGKSVLKGTGTIEAEDDAVVTVTNSQQNADARIDRADNVTVNNIPPWVFILAIVGWVLPSPRQCWLAIKHKLTLSRGRK